MARKTGVTKTGVTWLLALGALMVLAACGADGAPAVEGGMDLDEFWRR